MVSFELIVDCTNFPAPPFQPFTLSPNVARTAGSKERIDLANRVYSPAISLLHCVRNVRPTRMPHTRPTRRRRAHRLRANATNRIKAMNSTRIRQSCRHGRSAHRRRTHRRIRFGQSRLASTSKHFSAGNQAHHQIRTSNRSVIRTQLHRRRNRRRRRRRRRRAQ